MVIGRLGNAELKPQQATLTRPSRPRVVREVM
jgi:hypothetical protein